MSSDLLAREKEPLNFIDEILALRMRLDELERRVVSDSSPNDGIPEAPVDDLTYGRVNQTWFSGGKFKEHVEIGEGSPDSEVLRLVNDLNPFMSWYSNGVRYGYLQARTVANRFDFSAESLSLGFFAGNALRFEYGLDGFHNTTEVARHRTYNNTAASPSLAHRLHFIDHREVLLVGSSSGTTQYDIQALAGDVIPMGATGFLCAVNCPNTSVGFEGDFDSWQTDNSFFPVAKIENQEQVGSSFAISVIVRVDPVVGTFQTRMISGTSDDWTISIEGWFG